MRLADIIRQCQEAGVSSVELHPDGSVAKMVFTRDIQKVEHAAKKLTEEEKIRKAKDERNPRRNALELASEIHSDLRRERKDANA